jgi:Domain of unknown function (DUF6456)
MPNTKRRAVFSRSAEHLLLSLAGTDAPNRSARRTSRPDAAAARPQDLAALSAADLLTRDVHGELQVTAAGRAHARRAAARNLGNGLDPFLAQHLQARVVAQSGGEAQVLIDDAESPLAWLARRKRRDGLPLIAPEQLLAGERLRLEFTRAQLTPHVTANWSATVAQERRGLGNSPAVLTDAVIAARQRVRHALDAAGPDFSGLLLDVCCFLKGLEDVERERKWPPRSARIVLQFGLDRLARHYGFLDEARGPGRAPMRAWLAPEAFGAGGGVEPTT